MMLFLPVRDNVVISRKKDAFHNWLFEKKGINRWHIPYSKKKYYYHKEGIKIWKFNFLSTSSPKQICLLNKEGFKNSSSID